MPKYVVAHFHEIALKGRNRSLFETRLVENIQAQLGASIFERVERLESRIFITLKKNFDDATRDVLSRVFGITSFAPVYSVKPARPLIEQAAVALMQKQKNVSFAIRTKRSDKDFPGTSDEISAAIGATVVGATGARVNLTNPDITIFVEILSQRALITSEKYAGPGGLPVSISGKVCAMLSGGIDSPVAAWKVMKRGCEIVFAHFHSYPHTSKASITKVRELAKLVGAYQPMSVLYLIPFAEAQRQVVMYTEPKYRVLLYRRLMIRIVNELAKNERASAIVTGESIGQVASQTLPNLHATEAAADIPIFRPLIGDDKEEIITQAKKIGTYLTSIQPHDDCCTLFIPKNPSTNARISDLEREEQRMPIDELIHETIQKIEKEIV